MQKFLVGVISDCIFHQTNLFQVQQKYLHAIQQHSNHLPILLPNVLSQSAANHFVSHLAGLFLTGSASNIDPVHYGEPSACSQNTDPKRDSSVFYLLQAAFEKNLPVFGVCRGLQEINVFLGGTLQTNAHLQKNAYLHCQNLQLPHDQQYAARESIDLLPNSFLYNLALSLSLKTPPKKNTPIRLLVNSLHTQTIKTLAIGLVKEAVSAHDQMIEAIRYIEKNFVIAVQWHPEHHEALLHPFNAALFETFGKAVSEYGNLSLPPN